MMAPASRLDEPSTARRAEPGTLPREMACFHLADPIDLRIAVAQTQRLPRLEEVSDVDRSLIATIVSELGSNILKYAGRGTVRIARLERDDGLDIEIRAEDSGPGMANVELALQDHFSTGGTLGLGLPGVRRMADEFWIRSAVAAGTTVVARKRVLERAPKLRSVPGPSVAGAAWGAEGSRAPTSAFGRHDAFASVRPHPGQARGGDAALVVETGGGVLLAVIDITGHGPRAALLASEVEALIRQGAGPDLAQLMARLHASLQGTAGAAAGLLFIDEAHASFCYLGVGNTRAARIGRRPWRGVSRDGVLGARLPTPLVQTETLEPGDLLMLWTDGLPELEAVRRAESLAFRGAAEITRRLLAELARPHDDAGCLVLRWMP